jgi:hypothetical protein
LHDLRPVAGFFLLTGLNTIDEKQRSHGRTADNEFRGGRSDRSLTVKPAATAEQKGEDNEGYFQAGHRGQASGREGYHAGVRCPKTGGLR